MKSLFTARDDLLVDDLPRLSTRRHTENKRRLDASDIVEFYTLLDAKVSKNDLPRFVAFDLGRIPPFVPDATDFCTLATNV